MATAQDVIDSARYDLRDYDDGIGVGLDFDDTELLEYLNRMIALLDSALSGHKSDLTEAKESDIDTVADQDYVDLSSMNSGNWSDVRSVWLGSTRLEKVSLGYMRYTSQFRSGSAKPFIWTLSNDTILFPQGCDAAHTDLVIYYDKTTGDLAVDGNMPYNDRFNEFLREQLVLYAQGKKNDELRRSDEAFNRAFETRAKREVIKRNFVPRTYRYWEL